MPIFSGTGVNPSQKGLTTNLVSLNAGEAWIPPNGFWQFALGKYTVFQELDSITNLWRTVGAGYGSGDTQTYFCDGVNYRIANQSGCAVGALLTAAGSGYTSAPIVTASAGGSIWRAIVGGAVNTVVTVTNPGVGYTYPPVVLIQNPPAGGVPAAGYATLNAAGGVASITITDQGAGYTNIPLVALVNDPREGVNGVAVGYNASAQLTLTGAGTITAVVCLDHGNPQTAVPTLTFSGGGGTGAAATAIMNFSITGVTTTTPGVGVPGSVVGILAYDNFPTTAAAYVNPTIHANLLNTRPATIKAPVSAGAVGAAVVYDGGVYSSVPSPLVVQGSGAAPTTAPVVTLAVGGLQDVTKIWSD